MTVQDAKDSDSSEEGVSPDTPSTISPTDTDVLSVSENGTIIVPSGGEAS
jgi:hypothetical protein